MSDQATESTFERPLKRWRKTKWFYGIVLVYLAVTIAAVVSWSAYSHRKFREAVDPILARGEPLAWSDFATVPIPDEQNAAVLYQQAIDATVMADWNNLLEREFKDVLETREWKSYELIDEFTSKQEVRREYPKELQKLLGMAQGVLTLCRKARRRDKVDWGIDFSGSALEYTGSPGQHLYIGILQACCLWRR